MGRLPYVRWEDDGQGEGRRKSPEELRSPVHGREPGRNFPAHERPERHGRIEVPTGNPSERGSHHADRKAVREGDEEQIATRDDGTRADENQRERANEFRDGFPRGRNRHLPPPSAAYRCGVFLVSRSNPRTSSRDVRGRY